MILERIQGTSFPSPNEMAVHETSCGLLLHREFSSNGNFTLKAQMRLTLPHSFQSFVSKGFNSHVINSSCHYSLCERIIPKLPLTL